MKIDLNLPKDHLGPLRIAQQFRAAGIGVAGLALYIVPLDLVSGVLDLFYVGEPPRTHPLTITCIALALLATLVQRPLRRAIPLERALWTLVITIAALKPVTQPWVTAQFDGVNVGTMGTNTAFTLTVLAAGQLLRSKAPTIGAAMALLACILPLMALNGHLMGQTNFFGSMAIPTAVATFGLGIANVIRYSRKPVLRILMRSNPTSRLVRRQLQCWLLVAAAASLALRYVGDYTSANYALQHTLFSAAGAGLIIMFGLGYARLAASAHNLQKDLVKDLWRDELTGATTRRAAQLRFNDMIGKSPVLLLVVDIDHFKSINDTFGHATGDEVLKSVANILKARTRITDEVVRWGGDEFLIFMPVQSRSCLDEKIADIGTEVVAAMRNTHGQRSVTVSVGGVLIPMDEDIDLAAGVAMADPALYEAKTRGRNTAVMIDDMPELQAA